MMKTQHWSDRSSWKAFSWLTMLAVFTVPDRSLAMSPPEDALLASFSAEIGPIMKRHCGKCHGESKQEGGLRLDKLSPAMSLEQDVEVWESVRDALSAHEMRPEEERQPSGRERQQIVAWIDASFQHVAERHQAHRASLMQRLTVHEYENTLQDSLRDCND